MTDYNQFQVGGVVQPLPTALTNSLLRDADPTLYFALDFWAYVITTYPGPRLVAAAAAAGITIPDAVGTRTYPYEPEPEWLENQLKVPALFAYRRDSQTEQWTAAWEHDVTEFELMYVLPPLDAAGSERVLPILNAIAQALRKKTSDAWDPGYTPPGGTLGDQFTAAPYANLQEIGFGAWGNPKRPLSRWYRMGKLPQGDDLWFPTLIMSGYFVERDMYAPTQGGPSKVAGADITGNVKAEDGTTVPAASVALVQVSTNPAPTVASLSVTTGPATGGTSTNITGTGFESGPPQVFFGPASNPTYAQSVTFNSSTSLTVVSPAMQGAGAVDVTVVNRDGQSVTFPQSFTFT